MKNKPSILIIPSMMNKISHLSIILVILITVGCTNQRKKGNILSSPSGNINIEFFLSPDGSPSYIVQYENENIIDTSSMGFDIKDQPSIASGFNIKETVFTSLDENWEMPWGEQRIVNNHYNENKNNSHDYNFIKKSGSL